MHTLASLVCSVMNHSLPILLVACSLSAIVECTGGEFSGYSQLVVIPDVHGDDVGTLRSLWLGFTKADGSDIAYEDFVARFGPMDDIDELTLGQRQTSYPPLSVRRDIAFVQLGDLVDRGPHSEKCIWIVSQIEHVIGWPVLSLLGNHEIMGMIPGEAGRFLHEAELDTYRGLLFREEVFANDGHVGEYLIDNYSTFLRFGGGLDSSTLFVHGGVDFEFIHESFGEYPSVYELNNTYEMVLQSGYPEDVTLLNTEKSPVWTRIIAEEPENIACPLVDEILRRFRVAQIVVGHTPQTSRRVQTRCGNKLVLADVMISRWMFVGPVDESVYENGNPMALIMKFGEYGGLESVVSHYLDEEISIPTSSSFPKIGEVWLSNQMIHVAEWNGRTGLVQIFFDGQPRKEVFDRLELIRYEQVPRILAAGLVNGNVWTFIETKNTQRLVSLAGVETQVLGIMKAVHEQGLILGLQHAGPNLFGLAEDTITLTNFAHLQTATPEDIQIEWYTFLRSIYSNNPPISSLNDVHEISLKTKRSQFEEDEHATSDRLANSDIVKKRTRSEIASDEHSSSSKII